MSNTTHAWKQSRDFEPSAECWRSFAWSGGSFDTARRPMTRSVEGRINLCHPTIIAVLGGGCSHIEIKSECGHHYRGADFAGSISFIPESCVRHLKMTDVQTEWASFSIRTDFFHGGVEPAAGLPTISIPAFTNERDLFLYGLLAELQRLNRASGELTNLYCESMATSAAIYILHRYGVGDRAGSSVGNALLGWRLRRVKEFIAANLDDHELRLEEVARCVGLSTGFFHRAFKKTTGQTPLTYIQRQRIERAMRLLNNRDLSITNIAIGVGFLSPSHFARLFRKQTGLTPSQYRNGKG